MSKPPPLSSSPFLLAKQILIVSMSKLPPLSSSPSLVAKQIIIVSTSKAPPSVVLSVPPSKANRHRLDVKATPSSSSAPPSPLSIAPLLASEEQTAATVSKPPQTPVEILLASDKYTRSTNRTVVTTSLLAARTRPRTWVSSECVSRRRRKFVPTRGEGREALPACTALDRDLMDYDRHACKPVTDHIAASCVLLSMLSSKPWNI